MAAKKLGNDIVMFNTGHFLDIFWGRSGWKPHARFQKKRVNNKFTWSQIAGAPLPSHVIKTMEGLV